MGNILIVNDDGIDAKGIVKLAELAKKYGDVTVVAPSSQCSGMSHRITIMNPIRVEETDFPVEGVRAYKVDGTPADCAMLGCTTLVKPRPDFLFSGINDGYNTGIDTLYSGTVNAAMEAQVHGIKGIAFSIGWGHKDLSVVDRYFDEVMEHIISDPAPTGCVWNINFPGCDLDEVKGIKYHIPAAKMEFYNVMSFTGTEVGPGAKTYVPDDIHPTEGPEGTDMDAVLKGYIAAGIIRNDVLAS